MTKKIAIIGLGGWASGVHVPSCLRLQAEGLADYVAVCDLRQEAADATAARLDATAYTDVEKMLATESIDGLVLCVSPGITSKLIEVAISKNIPFLAEKPPAETVEVQQQLADGIGDLPHVIAYNRRFLIQLQQTLEWIPRSEIKAIEAQFYRNSRLDPDFTSTAVHPLDLLQYLAGHQFEEVYLEKSRQERVYNYHMTATAANGCHIQLAVMPDCGTNHEEYVIHAEQKTARLIYPYTNADTGSASLLQDNKVTATLDLDSYGPAKDNQYVYNGVYFEHRHFLDVLNGHCESISTLANTILTQKLRDAFLKLPDDGGRVLLKQME